MIAHPYTFTEDSGSLVVEWISRTLPIELRFLALGLLVLLPLLFVFRGPISRFADRHLHIHWSPKVYGILAPIVSVMCALILLFARTPSPSTTWKFNNEGVSVVAPEGTTDLKWPDLASVHFEPVAKEKFTLVLTSIKGPVIRLEIFRIDGSLQEKIVEWVGHRFRLEASLPEIPDEEDLDDALSSPPSSSPKK